MKRPSTRDPQASPLFRKFRPVVETLEGRLQPAAMSLGLLRADPLPAALPAGLLWPGPLPAVHAAPSAGPVASFAVTAPNSAVAGTAFDATITVEDALGHIVTGYSGPVTLTASDGQAVSPGTITLTNGTGSAHVMLKTADTVALRADASAAKPAVHGASATITVLPAAVTTLLVVAPSTANVDVGFPVTVTARDAYGNTVPTFAGTARLSSSDGQSVSPATVTLAHGVGTATVSLHTAGATRLAAAAGQTRGTSDSIVVSAEMRRWEIEFTYSYQYYFASPYFYSANWVGVEKAKSAAAAIELALTDLRHFVSGFGELAKVTATTVLNSWPDSPPVPPPSPGGSTMRRWEIEFTYSYQYYFASPYFYSANWVGVETATTAAAAIDKALTDLRHFVSGFGELAKVTATTVLQSWPAS